MTEFLTNNSIYVVFIISLIIWLGLASFIFNVDKKIRRLEENISSKNTED